MYFKEDTYYDASLKYRETGKLIDVLVVVNNYLYLYVSLPYIRQVLGFSRFIS